MLRHFQEMYFEENYMQTVESNGYSVPDFSKIAYAYGLAYYRILTDEDLTQDMFTADGPAVIELMFPFDTYVYPKLAVHMPIHDQEPPIDRALYHELMAL